MSSVQRKTAFARVPRGTNRGQNSSGPTLRIDKRFLDSLASARLAPDMSTVLTKTSAELSVTITSSGSGSYNMVRSGDVVGDAQDVQKIQTLGSFINDERKAVLKSSVSQNTKKTLAAVVEASRDPKYANYVPRPITKISKSFVDVFRSVDNQMGIMTSNFEAIVAAPAEGAANSQVKNHLIETANRAKEAVGQFLFAKAGAQDDGVTSIRLNDFLLEKKVLSWVFSRLTGQKLQIGGKDFEFRKVYFPKDITKGLSLSFEEFNNQALVGNQGPILQGLQPFAGLWRGEALRAICGIPEDWDLNDFGPDKPARALRNVPLMVVPFLGATTPEENITALARSGDRGLPFSVGNTLTAQDCLKFLGTIPKRVFHGLVPRPAMKSDLIESLFLGFKYDRSPERDRGVYAQLSAWTKEGGKDLSWFTEVLSSDEVSVKKVRPKVLGMYRALFDYGTNTKVGDPVEKTVGHSLAIPFGSVSYNLDVWSELLTLKRTLAEGRAGEILTGILDVNLDSRKKKPDADDGVRTARSPLGIAGEALVLELKRRKFTLLSHRIGSWLRSFLSVTVQTAVAEVMRARLEASLANPVVFDHKDRTSYFEGGEWAADVQSEADGDDGDDAGDDDNPDEN